MPDCNKCGRSVKQGFTFFCRRCYKDEFRRLFITDDDFLRYLNISLKTTAKFPYHWRFPEIHYWYRYQFPTIKPLANVLENILFLKMLASEKEINSP